MPRRLFTRALTINSASSSLTSVTGPALGGLLIATGGSRRGVCRPRRAGRHRTCISLMPLHMPARQRPRGRIRAAAVREGLAFVWDRPVLLGAMTLDMFAVLFGGARALLPVYAVDVLHADAVGYGILSASLEAGTLLMALMLIVLLPIPRHTGRLLLLAVAGLRAGDGPLRRLDARCRCRWPPTRWSAWPTRSAWSCARTRSS